MLGFHVEVVPLRRGGGSRHRGTHKLESYCSQRVRYLLLFLQHRYLMLHLECSLAQTGPDAAY